MSAMEFAFASEAAGRDVSKGIPFYAVSKAVVLAITPKSQSAYPPNNKRTDHFRSDYVGQRHFETITQGFGGFPSVSSPTGTQLTSYDCTVVPSALPPDSPSENRAEVQIVLELQQPFSSGCSSRVELSKWNLSFLVHPF